MYLYLCVFVCSVTTTLTLTVASARRDDDDDDVIDDDGTDEDDEEDGRRWRNALEEETRCPAPGSGARSTTGDEGKR